MGTATAVAPSRILVVPTDEMVRLLHEEPGFSDRFIEYMLYRNIRIEEDLVDQLFNPGEKRLARTLLLLARYGKEGKPQGVLPKLSQEMLAEMIGSTRIAREHVHEQIQEARLHRVQRWPQNQQLPPQRGPARIGPRTATFAALTIPPDAMLHAGK
jgi:CRP/FNR family transcriptional regulator, cyclic AMP receptor protein